jgi:hypothetical protein
MAMTVESFPYGILAACARGHVSDYYELGLAPAAATCSPSTVTKPAAGKTLMSVWLVLRQRACRPPSLDPATAGAHPRQTLPAHCVVKATGQMPES